ncbi:DUF1003 domain-containing protein [Actinokineospora terrae]|uniref:DUF1003 domain-containing protein n=1 Tax=Actinokineospora terrae TaxID=155974 RepID=A0A1H9X3N0_9PSEU|nr:DUF1003 domain-containing protein [Actinokineospora terrae]SES40233.1 Protein of unknown function [Actinokineospora terrae]
MSTASPTGRSPGHAQCARTATATRPDAGRLRLRIGVPAAGPARAEHPVVARMREHRGGDRQLRLADAITRFAGSMVFVYIHVVVFAVWMLGVETSPWPTLTLVVSLEAIFLSTFVMIGQNRAALFQQAKADHDFAEQELELKTNTQLTREIHLLTTELHRRAFAED